LYPKRAAPTSGDLAGFWRKEPWIYKVDPQTNSYAWSCARWRHKYNATVVTVLPRFLFGIDQTRTYENEGLARISVYRYDASVGSGANTPFAAPASVRFATSDGTARAGVDYEWRTGVVEFGPGERNKEITIRIFDDGLLQSDRVRQFAVTLSEPHGAEIAPDHPAAQVLILDNEIAAGIDFPWIMQRRG
jgi:hypothetical protein